MADVGLFDQQDREYLDFTLSTRKAIADEMLKKGIPDDKEDRQFLLQALDGVDRTVLSRARIKADDSANKNQANMTSVVAALLSKVHVQGVLKANEDHAIEIGSTNKPRELDSGVVIEGQVIGETDIGVSDTNYDTFITSMENQ